MTRSLNLIAVTKYSAVTADFQACDGPTKRAACLLYVPGLGVVQALPGPLFNFSAYLGVIIAMNAGYNFMVGAVLAWFGLFSPGVMIIFGE